MEFKPICLGEAWHESLSIAVPHPFLFTVKQVEVQIPVI